MANKPKINMKTETMNQPTQENYFTWLMNFSKKYEISFQMWPNQYTIYIAKDGIDLWSFGCSEAITTMDEALKYLNRINKKKNRF